jgi:hypothetical protein
MIILRGAKMTKGGIIGLTITIIVVLVFLTDAVMCNIYFVGIPKDKDILKIEFIKTKSKYRETVFGTNYQSIVDEYGNNLIIVTDCYESNPYHWVYIAKQKSFYGTLDSVKHYNDIYYIPAK